MKFEFTGRHIEVTPALRAHVKEQFEGIRYLLDGKLVKAHVIIEVERGRHRSEIILKWHDKTLAAHSAMADMYLSLSKTVDKLEKQILKFKNKVEDKHHKAKKLSSLPGAPTKPKATRRGATIVVNKAYKVKQMSPEAAAAALAADRAEFLLFTDIGTDRMSLIYKRPDGKFGLIAP